MKTIKQSRYFILESGSYSDYTVDFIEVPLKLKITKKEIEFVLNIDRYDDCCISGEIVGVLKGWEPMVLKTKLGAEIDRFFSCYENRPIKSILDRIYTEYELIKIATTNDSSGIDYWNRRTNNNYSNYLKAFEIYKKL